ncbi:Alpha/Beta hydrolase protein [Lophiotrema nucula]|uniref:Alpha/Beta hydrolase protein n=1 Tax=Lophiotrema nucula TaxID=690887 RepID=A0A6A5ZKH1_9PLEO|nr:Alpha/Beta hydrolase protein [Lophiotrema nucula]
MAASCNDCIKGTIHQGLPIGKEETIHGLNTYVVGNRTNARGIIVMYSDIFGLSLPNNKLIADAYAKSGEWLVYLPDFFEGDPLSLKIADLLLPVDASKQSTFGKYTGLLASAPSFVMWQTRHKVDHCKGVCKNFMAKLRRATTGQKIGMVGFCWGGKYASWTGLEQNMIDVDSKKVPLVDAIVALHPSHLAVPEDVEHLVVPVSYAWGVEDSVVPFEQKAKVEATHTQAKKAGKVVPEIEHKVYRPGRHGFSVRGNPDDPQERASLEDTVTQVLEWFARWL